MGRDDYQNSPSHPVPWDVFQQICVPWDQWDGTVPSRPTRSPTQHIIYSMLIVGMFEPMREINEISQTKNSQ
jgi:hypothetical protein